MASVFDIEATSFYTNGEKQCTMYAWVFGINGECIRGRTWKEFFDVLDKLIKFYNLNLNKRFIIYVHNLSYEFQWFKNYFEWEKVFSLDSRKPIYALTKQGIEFRCSYLLSGYSLEKLGENLTKYKVEKKVGDLNYSLLRHSETILTDKEWGYILNDGLVVMAHIQEEIERLGSIVKIPLTKTGYVRKLCQEKCLKGENRWTYTKLIKNLTLTPETYQQLKRAFTGGFTHANINYVDQEIRDVHSYDFTSSYPTVMLSEKFPMSKPFNPEIKTEEEFYTCLQAYCCMFECEFYNIQSNCEYENYISISRCINAEHYVSNNGRLVEADYIKLTLTEQDFFIILNMYKWDSFIIHNMNCFYKDYLPQDFILAILELYEKKTQLKDVEGKEVEYMVSKNMLNSTYGMCVTDICRDEIIYEGNEWTTKQGNIKELIEEYNNNKQRFLYYAWGVWVTAYARHNLFDGIFEFKNDYIYSDTDSIKVVNIDKHKGYIDNYNKRIKEKIKDCFNHYKISFERAEPKTKDGKAKPLGIWDYEGKYDRFKTLGAKRYLTEKNGKISITIAGVSKKAGAKYLKEKYKTNDEIFNNFKEDLYFPPIYEIEENGETIEENGSGKLCHTYIDISMSGELTDYMGKTSTYYEQSGVHMENTDYTMSITGEFKKLLMGIKGEHLI